MIKKTFLMPFATTAILSLGSLGAFAQDDGQTLMLMEPTLSSDNIAFIYAGDIYVADRDGNGARRLTTSSANEQAPHFSPDGQSIAYTANYENNNDVYVISVNGGQPNRLTWHSGADMVNGWTPDGDNVVFASGRDRISGRSPNLYHVSTSGGFPTKVMTALAEEGAWSSDQKYLAMRPTRRAHAGSSAWRFHRGGSTPIWIYEPSSGETVIVPRGNQNDFNPMWVGDRVYYLSDQDEKAINIYSFKAGDNTPTKHTTEGVWDTLSADAHGNNILYSMAGKLMELDTVDNSTREIKVSLNPDLPQLRAGWKDATRQITNFGISPSGKRALITARGDVFTVPVEDGSTRNITSSDRVRESGAIWASDGGKIAYVSDAGMEHKLHITDQMGGQPKILDLGPTSSYYTLDLWSPDNKRIIYRDNHLNIYSILLDDGSISKVGSSSFRPGIVNVPIGMSFSPDSDWLAYSSSEKNQMSPLKLYNFETGVSTTVTDSIGDVSSIAFSQDGKYLYFAASTTSGTQKVFLDMSVNERVMRHAIYAVVLAKDEKSPLLPKSGNEKVKKEKEKKESDETEEGDKSEGEDADEAKELSSKIDLEGLGDRIIALPVSEKNYSSLNVGSDGSLYYLDNPQQGAENTPPGSGPGPQSSLVRFDMKKKEASNVLSGVGNYTISADGENILVLDRGNRVSTGKLGAKIKLKPLNTSDVKMFIDPKNEWAQIFDDVWWMEKEFFYDPNMHNLDWGAIYTRYKTLLPHVGRREDLNTLLREMIAEVQVGHNRTGGGDTYRDQAVNVGLLGADYAIENGAYRVKKIYSGENWNPFLSGPLAIPGIGVSEGDYILSVNGRPLSGDDNIFAHFQSTVGRQVTLSISASPTGEDVWDVIVEPVGSEAQLRHWYWVEKNRKYVADASDGRLGYVYLPNTAGAGYTYFNRMFFAQIDKEGMIIDERRNGGGQAANYITDVLSRTYLAGWKDRDGEIFDTPAGAVYGPKVMLIDQDAGSGGDFLPYSFREMGIGKLVGTKTWGGLIGISANPDLVDGGFLTVPFFRFFNAKGEWTVENIGVSPDIEVQLMPGDVNNGIDAQLERSVREALKELETFTPVRREEAPEIPTKPGG